MTTNTTNWKVNDTEQWKELGIKWMDGYNIEDITLKGKKYVFNKKQAQFINAKNDYILYSGGYGCLPGYAPIKTKDGYKTIKDISIGDRILGEENGTTKECSVINKINSGKKEVFRIHTVSGKFIDATREHIFKIKRQYWVHGKYRKETEEWSIDRIIKYLDANKLNSKNIGLVRPDYITYPDKPKLKIDPYLLGVLLGDGHIGKYCIGLTSDLKDKDLRDKVNGKLKQYNCRLSKHKAQYSYGIVSNDSKNRLRQLFKDIGVESGNKFIPEEYFRTSRKNRLELLAGLIDTDGYQYTGKYEFVNKEKRLSDGFKRLVEELGGKATVNIKRIDDTDYYRVYSALNCKVPCALKRKQNSGKQQRDYRKDRIDGYESLGVMDTYDITIDNESSCFLSYNDFITHNCGKSLALYVKLILLSLFFPGNRILLGRKTLSDIDRAVLPDLFDLLPSSWYAHRVKDAVINFSNGSQILLFGLDALQTGSEGDIKKAEQKVKSLNLGAFFIDQLEEIEYNVFDALGTRLRREGNVLLRQGNMTTNPANFWAYHYFKKGLVRTDEGWMPPKKKLNNLLLEGSLFDNKHLPKDYIDKQMNHTEKWIKRYVYGEWSPDVLTDRAVFGQEYITKLETLAKRPKSKEEGCEIWEEYIPGMRYRMGIDPSEGQVDPSSITIITEDGRKVAKFNGYIPIFALGNKVNFLYYKYHKPLIIPEVNAAGQALLLQIRDLNVYRRKTYEERWDKEQEKLGWKTNYQSKQALIDNFQDLLRKDFIEIYDRKTIDEFKTFVWSDSAREKGAGAQRGFHDDDVMSTMLAYWELTPGTLKKKQRIEAKRSHRKIKRFQYK